MKYYITSDSGTPPTILYLGVDYKWFPAEVCKDVDGYLYPSVLTWNSEKEALAALKHYRQLYPSSCILKDATIDAYDETATVTNLLRWASADLYTVPYVKLLEEIIKQCVNDRDAKALNILRGK